MKTTLKWAVAVMVAVAFAVAGCGGSDNSTDSTAASADTTATSADTSANVVADAKQAVERDYAGTDRKLPTDGPKAQSGKTVWVISCTQAGAGCALPAAAAVEAGQAIGWNMKLVDGKYDPAVWNEQIRAATAAGADGIIMVAFDCPAVQGSLAAAKSAGVKIYGLYALDCDDIGGKPQFDGTLSYGDLGSYADYIENEYAKAVADYAIAKTDGKANAIALESDDLLIVKHINDGFNARFAQCKTCQLHVKKFTGADFLGGKLQAFTAAMLTQYPDANVVVAPYDAAILLGMGAAVQQAKAQGRDITLLGGEGLPPNIDLIKQGQQTAAFGLPSTWAGWAAVDGLNRVFAGDPQVDAGIGHQTIDAEHNIPTGPDGYPGNAKSQGFKDNYRQIWGVG